MVSAGQIWALSPSERKELNHIGRDGRRNVPMGPVSCNDLVVKGGTFICTGTVTVRWQKLWIFARNHFAHRCLLLF